MQTSAVTAGEVQRILDQEKRAALFQDAAPNSKGE
jgi:hypothetical protein